jgi:FMN phosphatase YigB (HAD superfamily)
MVQVHPMALRNGAAICLQFAKAPMNPLHAVRAVCFDWGGTLMSERGPQDIPMGLWPEVEVIEGAAEALASLAGKLPLAIATNASVSRRPMIELALRRAGLGSCFAHIFCYTELGHRKDQREFWLAVQNGLGVPLSHIAMVGDSYEQDALYPRRFGVQGVWFNPGGYAPSDRAAPMVDSLITFAAWAAGATEPA